MHKAAGLSKTTLSKCLKEIDPTLLSKTKVGRKRIYTLLSTQSARELTRITVVGRRKREEVARMRSQGLDPDWILPLRGPKTESQWDEDAQLAETFWNARPALRYAARKGVRIRWFFRDEAFTISYTESQIEEIKQTIKEAEDFFARRCRFKHPVDDESILWPN